VEQAFQLAMPAFQPAFPGAKPDPIGFVPPNRDGFAAALIAPRNGFVSPFLMDRIGFVPPFARTA
jgi:hypothetical protein